MDERKKETVVCFAIVWFGIYDKIVMFEMPMMMMIMMIMMVVDWLSDLGTVTPFLDVISVCEE